MQEASFTGLLRTLLIFFTIYYVLKFIGRYVLPLFIKRTVSKMEEKFRAQQEAQEPPKKVGEITIEKTPVSKQKKTNESGEYIDFEEVD